MDYLSINLFNEEFKGESLVLQEESHWKQQYKFLQDILSATVANYIANNLIYELKFLLDYPLTTKTNAYTYAYKEKTTIELNFLNGTLVYLIKINTLIDLIIVLEESFLKSTYNNPKSMCSYLIENKKHIINKIQISLDNVLSKINNNSINLKEEVISYIEEFILYEKTSFLYKKEIPELNVKYDFIPSIYRYDKVDLENELKNIISIHYRTFYIWDYEKDIVEFLYLDLSFHYIYTFHLDLDKLKESVLLVFYEKIRLMYHKTVTTLKHLISERYKDFDVEFMDYDMFIKHASEPIVYLNNVLYVNIFFKYEEYLIAKECIQKCLKLSKYSVKFKYMTNKSYIYETNTVSFFIKDNELEEFIKKLTVF